MIDLLENIMFLKFNFNHLNSFVVYDEKHFKQIATVTITRAE